jgi:putative membrane protein
MERVSPSLDPGPIALLLVALALYARATVVLRRRGRRLAVAQQTAWYAGLLLLGVALVGPLDALASRLMSAHMAQHVLIADLAVPLMLMGLRTPVLLFYAPRPVLIAVARRTRVRRVFATLSRPLVAVPFYVATLYLWHLGFMFEGALRSGALHALQHLSFVVTSALVWWAPLEPGRLRVGGELWKAGHVLAARLGGTMLGMALLAMRAPAYSDFYGDAARAFGLTPLADQQVGGALMMIVDVIVMLGALSFFFWRAAGDHDSEEQSRADGRGPLPAVPQPSSGSSLTRGANSTSAPSASAGPSSFSP